MAKVRFFDTCALQHRYVDGDYSRRIRQLTSDKRYECVLADASVLEMTSALAKRCRSGRRDAAVFDRWEEEFFRDVAEGRLRVRPTTLQDRLRARHLLRFAGALLRRNLSSGDALLASACLALAQERSSVVTFYTSDWTLYSTIREVDAFTSALRLVFVGLPRDGGPAVCGRRRG